MSMGSRLLPDVCGCPVSWEASVDIRSEGNVPRWPSLAHHLFSSPEPKAGSG